MPAKASRVAFGEALIELGAKDERIVTLDADPASRRSASPSPTPTPT